MVALPLSLAKREINMQDALGLTAYRLHKTGSRRGTLGSRRCETIAKKKAVSALLQKPARGFVGEYQ